MATHTQSSFDLVSTYVSVARDASARPLEVTDSFWPDVMAGRHPELDQGWLVGAFDYADDWGTWEVHPAGDEIVSLLSGAIAVVLEQDGREWTVELRAGETVVVPRGAWHRAVVREPGRALHITPGAGTDHRPYEGTSS